MNPWLSLVWFLLGTVVGSFILHHRITIRRLKGQLAKAVAEWEEHVPLSREWARKSEAAEKEIAWLRDANETLLRQVSVAKEEAARARNQARSAREHLGSLQEQNTQLRAMNRELLGRFKELTG